MKWNIPAAYQLLRSVRIEELDADAMILEHRRTGARIFTVSNSDDNKVFTIGFRTTPRDSTGVPHITEHTVLCGSEKFPVKDPFRELVKGSLNTFLNAMTYPDKTVYPVASYNEQDFQNLMDVYMDAVLHPAIYRHPEIFSQEGWHYELDNIRGSLTYNGVVYNEMKGAFSSAESVLDRCILNTLFPDTCYGVESGGDPEVIPELTYQQFLDFHRHYYHPSNSFIYLYGDMNMEEKLTWLDEAYLGAYERDDTDTVIRPQKPFEKPVEKEIPYAITQEDSEDHATYLSWTAVVDDRVNPEHFLAFQVLQYLLLDSPGGILKEALQRAGIGEEIQSTYESGTRQPYFSVIAKNAEKEQKDEFLEIIRRVLRQAADEGLNKKSLYAAINNLEFKMREADYGAFPKGLLAGLQSFESWLYGEDPTVYLRYQAIFERLKAGVEEGYFEALIRSTLLDNPFSCVITVVPKRGLTQEREKALEEKLARKLESMDTARREEIMAQMKGLRAYQQKVDTPENLAKIPLLSRSDIRRKVEPLSLEIREHQGMKILAHPLFTNGIDYVRLMFATDRIPQEDLPYAALLGQLLGNIGTASHSLQDLTDEMNMATGGINTELISYQNLKEKDRVQGMFCVNMKAFTDSLDRGLQLVREILLSSALEDKDRIKQVIDETRSAQQARLMSAGHAAAAQRAASYFAADRAWDECTGGITFFDFLTALSNDFAQQADALADRLKRTAARLFTRDNLLVSLTAPEKEQSRAAELVARLSDALPEGDGRRWPFSVKKGNRNEGFMTPAQVNYVARCGDYSKAGLPYTGALKILKVALGYEYLWKKVREEGGAYGVMASFGRTGNSYMVSYRDPKLAETDQVYESVPEYVRGFDCDEREMTKLVIGTISDMDTPLLPQYKGIRGDAAYFAGIDDRQLQKERDQVLDAGVEDIRALAPYVEAMLAEGAFCVIGSSSAIEDNRDKFMTVRNLVSRQEREA